MTAAQALEHPWIVSGGPNHSDPLLAALDSLKQFHTMNKLKRKALLVPLLLLPHTHAHITVPLRMLRCTSPFLCVCCAAPQLVAEHVDESELSGLKVHSPACVVASERLQSLDVERCFSSFDLACRTFSIAWTLMGRAPFLPVSCQPR